MGCIPEIKCSDYCPYAGQYCDKGKCKFLDCRQDDDCKNTNDKCIQGVCETTDCVLKKCYTCEARKCQGECIKSICNLKIRCIDIDDCSEDQICSFHKELGYNVCSVLSCEDSNDSSKTCKKTPPIGCNADKECEKGKMCKFGNCILEDQECTDNSCMYGQTCIDGKCKSLDCYKHEDCKEQSYCMQGECTDVTELPSCSKDSPCSARNRHKCINGKCYPIIVCKVNSDCGKRSVCDLTFKIKGNQGICVKAINCNPQIEIDSGCPVNMHCPKSGFCKTKECRHCAYDETCTEILTSQTMTCWPIKHCTLKGFNNGCDGHKFCNIRLGICENHCADCAVGAQCVDGVCKESLSCSENIDCPPRQLCYKGQCDRDFSECYNHNDCPDEDVGCFAGLCKKICKDCQLELCDANNKCMAKCSNSDKCQKNYYCYEGACIPKMKCSNNRHCPVDMICKNKDTICNGEESCSCQPETDCKKCTNGRCNAKICSIVVETNCKQCKEGFVCPNFENKKYHFCHKTCHPYDKSSCLRSSCLLDKNSVYVCMPNLKCKADSECIIPLQCKNFQCTRPDCFKDRDCEFGEFCYAGKCRLPEIDEDCTQDADCDTGKCIVFENFQVGVCLVKQCTKDCPHGRCKHGFCDYNGGSCLNNEHCDEYSKCENGLCMNKGCSECKTG